MNITKEKLLAMKVQAEQEREQLLANLNGRMFQIGMLEQLLKDLDAPEPAAEEPKARTGSPMRNGKVPNA